MSKARFAKQALSIAAFLLFAACTTMDEPVDLGGGVRGYQVSCGGWPWTDKDNCVEHAQHMCGDGGYTVISQGAPPYAHSEWVWNHSTYEMMVRCNQSPLSK